MMKSRMGWGLDVMMVHTLRRRMFSMAPSTTKLLPIRPRMQYRPVPMPKRQAAASTMRMSLAIRALPISIEVYLARIRATMSVPPVDAPMSNTMAAPSAGRNTANTRSSMASPLMDTPEGYSHSHIDTKKDRAKDE